MIIRCFACSTRFRIDPAALGVSGRRVRCTSCGHVWLELPQQNVSPQAEPKVPPPAPSPPPSPERGGGVWIGWLVAGFVVAVVLTGLALGRNTIVAAWPDTVGAYDSAGLPIRVPHADGLRIAEIESERVQGGNGAVLLVRGVIENTIENSRTVPTLQAVLVDEAGTELHRWRVAAVSTVLGAGQSTTFESWLAEPPEGAARVTVGFVAEDQG